MAPRRCAKALLLSSGSKQTHTTRTLWVPPAKLSTQPAIAPQTPSHLKHPLGPQGVQSLWLPALAASQAAHSAPALPLSPGHWPAPQPQLVTHFMGLPSTVQRGRNYGCPRVRRGRALCPGSLPGLPPGGREEEEEGWWAGQPSAGARIVNAPPETPGSAPFSLGSVWSPGLQPGSTRSPQPRDQRLVGRLWAPLHPESPGIEGGA